MPAPAQQPDRTGTGGSPTTTVIAPNTTSSGTTKPLGEALGQSTPSERREDAQFEWDDNKVDASSCVGCNR